MYDFLGYGNISEDLLERAKKDYQKLMDQLVERAAEANFTDLKTEIVYGNPKELLTTTLPKKYQVDLIMVGQSGLSGLERMMIGSVSQYVISHAPCDVLVVNPKGYSKGNP
jgi:nucleotide-binding universal stress UspA family protein